MFSFIPIAAKYSFTDPTLPPLLSPVDSKTGFCSVCGTFHLPYWTENRLTYPEMCAREIPRAVPVVLLGGAGSGVGSRFKGHSRMGGNKLAAQLVHDGCVLAVTNEYRTSQLCAFCHQQVRHPRLRVVVNDKYKIISDQGAVYCTNPACASVRHGFAARGRDQNACINIAINGAHILQSDQHIALGVFNPTIHLQIAPALATPITNELMLCSNSLTEISSSSHTGDGPVTPTYTIEDED